MMGRVRWATSERPSIGILLVAVVVLGVPCEGAVRFHAKSKEEGTVAAALILPEFICTVRAYGGARFDDLQRRSMKELGLEYVQGLVDFTWDHIERGDNMWKWVAADGQIDQLARSGLKVIAFLICPKSPGLLWDETITRADPRFTAVSENGRIDMTETDGRRRIVCHKNPHPRY